jgi:hypothetical protein
MVVQVAVTHTQELVLQALEIHQIRRHHKAVMEEVLLHQFRHTQQREAAVALLLLEAMEHRQAMR